MNENEHDNGILRLFYFFSSPLLLSCRDYRPFRFEKPVDHISGVLLRYFPNGGKIVDEVVGNVVAHSVRFKAVFVERPQKPAEN